MKKLDLLCIVLSLILMLAVCAGCSSEQENSAVTDDAPTGNVLSDSTITDSAENEVTEDFVADTSSDETTITDGIKIMPLGDSLTSGYTSADFGGYRTYLCNRLLAAGYSERVDFVGKWNTGSGYDTDHVGTNGHTVDDVRKMLDEENIMEAYSPDIVLLMIGTNDVNWDRKDLENIGDRYELLVDAVLSGLPENGLLYVCTIPYQVCDVETIDEDVDNFNESVREIAQRKVNMGYNVTLVDVNALITRDDLNTDGLHLTDAGYEKLGNMWYDILLPVIE